MDAPIRNDQEMYQRKPHFGVVLGTPFLGAGTVVLW
jgi:hypothetical protein